MKVVIALLVSTFVLSAEPTLIEQRINASREAIARNNKDFRAYNDLALALVRRARETANPQRCVDAETPVAQSLKIAPSGFEGRRARVAVWICEKRWTDALEEATALHNQVMDDVPTWGYIADAQTALGNYEEAAKAIQWMINMRQASPQALQRAATVREAYGMNEPALDWLTSALHLTSGTDFEERAWLLTRIARLNRIMGRNKAADDLLTEALTMVPDYPWALTERGLNLIAQKKYTAAITILQHRQSVAPNIPGLYDSALALSAAGQSEEAQQTFLIFEKAALPLITKADNANLELIAYYSGVGNKAAEAVRIAQDMLTRRHDLDTLAACAEALAAEGEWKSASERMGQALKLGAKNPSWLVEAGKIARKTGDETAARKYFQQAMEAAPASPISEEAMLELVKTGS